MTQAIDVLIIDPVHADACKTVAGIRRKAPSAFTVRVFDVDQAERLMFDRGLFSEAPQIPALIILDLGEAQESALQLLRRLRTNERTATVPVVIFSARRDGETLLRCHLLGVQMNLIKPADPNEYATAVERVMATWLSRGFTVAEADERGMQPALASSRARRLAVA